MVVTKSGGCNILTECRGSVVTRSRRGLKFIGDPTPKTLQDRNSSCFMYMRRLILYQYMWFSVYYLIFHDGTHLLHSIVHAIHHLAICRYVEAFISYIFASPGGAIFASQKENAPHLPKRSSNATCDRGTHRCLCRRSVASPDDADGNR